MQQFESEIIHYTEDIWKSILDLDVKKSEDTFCNQGGESILAGFVQITGSWEGAVALDRPVELSKKVASIMFQLKEDETTADLIEDGLGELTNIREIQLLPEKPIHHMLFQGYACHIQVMRFMGFYHTISSANFYPAPYGNSCKFSMFFFSSQLKTSALNIKSPY